MVDWLPSVVTDKIHKITVTYIKKPVQKEDGLLQVCPEKPLTDLTESGSIYNIEVPLHFNHCTDPTLWLPTLLCQV